MVVIKLSNYVLLEAKNAGDKGDEGDDDKRIWLMRCWKKYRKPSDNLPLDKTRRIRDDLCEVKNAFDDGDKEDGKNNSW